VLAVIREAEQLGVGATTAAAAEAESCGNRLGEVLTAEVERWQALSSVNLSAVTETEQQLSSRLAEAQAAARAHADAAEDAARDRASRMEEETGCIGRTAAKTTSVLAIATKKLAAFVSEADARPTPEVSPSREPHVWTEQLAATPDEEQLRELFVLQGGAEADVNADNARTPPETRDKEGGAKDGVQLGGAKENAGARNAPVDTAELAKAKVPELRRMLDERNLPTDGQKHELVTRLVRSTSMTAKGAPPSRGSTPSKTPRRPRSDPPSASPTTRPRYPRHASRRQLSRRC